MDPTSSLSPEMRARMIELERLLEQERRAREDAERRVEDAERQTEEEHRGRLREKQQRIAVEALYSETAFIPCLYYCYALLFLPVSAQQNSSLSSTGGFTDVTSRFYPRELRPWTEFPSLHEECFTSLCNLFGDQKLFPSLGSIMQVGRDLSPSPLAEEQDLRPFEMLAIELRVKQIVAEYLKLVPQHTARVIFRSNPYSLQKNVVNKVSRPEPTAVPTDQPDQATGRSEDQSPDLKRTASGRRGRSSKRPASSPPASNSPSPSKKSSPERRNKPDRWCIRQDMEGIRKQLFVIEYKAAHKLTVKLLRLALDGIPDPAIFANAVRRYNRLRTSPRPENPGGDGENPGTTEKKKRAAKKNSSPDSEREFAQNGTAQVLTQAFHYMMDGGLAYSYVTSGESIVFLYVDQSDPTILYYHLAQPKEHIHLPPTARAQPVDEAVINQHAHLMKSTPIAMVLTLVLLALKKMPLSAEGKAQVQSQLVRWGALYGDETPGDSTAGQLQVTDAVRPEPVAGGGATSCRDPEKRRHRDDDNSDNDDEGVGPSGPHPQQAVAVAVAHRPSASSGSPGAGSGDQPGSRPGGKQSRGTQHAKTPLCPRPPLASYCTQKCLLGLQQGQGRPLDEDCPNVSSHRQGPGGNYHQISPDQLRGIIQKQLHVNLDDSCQALDSRGKFGAIGALFKVTARPYGYTLVAKGVQAVHRSCLSLEARAYMRLSSLQGTVVPVYLGTIDLSRNYILDGGAYITRMMLLSYGGENVKSVDDSDISSFFRLLMKYGVEHEDLRRANLLWNEELHRVMVIDFDRVNLWPVKRANSVGGQDRDAKRRDIESISSGEEEWL